MSNANESEQRTNVQIGDWTSAHQIGDIVLLADATSSRRDSISQDYHPRRAVTISRFARTREREIRRNGYAIYGYPFLCAVRGGGGRTHIHSVMDTHTHTHEC